MSKIDKLSYLAILFFLREGWKLVTKVTRTA